LGIFYFDLKYGTTKGTVTANSTLVKDFNRFYSSNHIDAEALGVGDALALTFTSSLDFLPVTPGTVIVTAGTITGTDDGANNITGVGITPPLHWQA
jgi:hypothetical protein